MKAKNIHWRDGSPRLGRHLGIRREKLTYARMVFVKMVVVHYMQNRMNDAMAQSRSIPMDRKTFTRRSLLVIQLNVPTRRFQLVRKVRSRNRSSFEAAATRGCQRFPAMLACPRRFVIRPLFSCGDDSMSDARLSSTRRWIRDVRHD
jgi:hypothetical protein